MKTRFLIPVALLLAAAGCDKVLQTDPTTQVPADRLITDAVTAQAALNGAYNALQDASYYGLDLEMLGDLPADNATWSGTFQFLNDIGTNTIQADNAEITAFWTQLYKQIDRDNVILDRVANVAGIPDATRNSVNGQAYFLRALGYHNLVKFWGAVPTPLVPVTSPADATTYTRTPVDQVYAQILSDLDKAATLITNTTNTRAVTVNAIRAIRSRVLFYRASIAGNPNPAADYQAALDAANLVLAGRDTLVEDYAKLFTPEGTNTTEDIFRVVYNTTLPNSLSNYYLQVGRHELTPTTDLNAAYPTGDLRKAWNIGPSGNTTRPLDGRKFRARPGTEHVHVIRLAELVLIKADVLARQNNLAAAVNEYNKVRIRAGLPKHVLGVDVTTQADVLAAIDRERRLELAFEGDRWPDLNRQGRAIAVKGLAGKPGQALFPIPLRDIRTSPGLTQNPGY
jgi:hypothetical protein